MTDLRSALERYLGMRKGLGYKYQHQTWRLADFVAFMEKREAATITTKLASMGDAAARSACFLGAAVKRRAGLCASCRQFRPQTEVPPAGMLPSPKRAKLPYVYSDFEINALLAAALALPPEDGLRRWTYHTLFGLIAVTGVRLSEATGLEHGDVDLVAGVLTLRLTKFGKSRLAPLHPTTCMALRAYRSAHRTPRSALWPDLLCRRKGGGCCTSTCTVFFWRLSREIGLRRPGDRTGPRIMTSGIPLRSGRCRLVSQWWRRREESPSPLHLSRPCLRARYLLVPLGLP